MSSNASLYVYYRIPRDHVGEALSAARRAAALIQASGAAAPRLMRRPQADRDGRQTWMEIYERWDPAWEGRISRALAESGLAALIAGERHEELFVDMEGGDSAGE